MKIDKNKVYTSSNPTEENIEYCFARLLYHATYILLLYSSSNENDIDKKIKEKLNYIRKWLKIYIKYKSLIYINHLELQKIRYNVIVFPEYVSYEKYNEIIELGYWILRLILLREYEINPNYKKDRKYKNDI